MGLCPINEIQVQWNTPGFRHIYGWAPSAVLKNIGPRITLEDKMCIYSITRTHTLSVWGQERIGWSQDWKQWAEHYWLIYESHRAGNRTKTHCSLTACCLNVASSKPLTFVWCKTLNMLQLLLRCNKMCTLALYWSKKCTCEACNCLNSYKKTCTFKIAWGVRILFKAMTHCLILMSSTHIIQYAQELLKCFTAMCLILQQRNDMRKSV